MADLVNEESREVNGESHEVNGGTGRTAVHNPDYINKYGSLGEFQLDESGGVAKIKTFEDILNIIGTFGKWNITVFFLCSMCTFFTPLQSITYEFLGATPDYWCHVEPLVEANWTTQQTLDLAIPKIKDGYEGCKYYNYNYTSAVEMGYETAMENKDTIAIDNGTAIKCSSRDFNVTQYKSTVVTEWDLVCERRVLYSTTQGASQAGIMIGCLLFGLLPDKYGRRPIILVCVVMSLIAGMATAFAPNFIFYVIMKALVSFFQTGFYNGCFILVMELCSTKQRTAIGSLFPIPWSVGYMAVPVIAYFIREWRWLQATYSITMICLLIYFWLPPESPRWLISQGRIPKAIKVFSDAAKMNKSSIPPTPALTISMEKMIPPTTRELQESLLTRLISIIKHLLIPLMKKDLRCNTLISFFNWFTVSMVYFGISLNASNLSIDPYLYVFLGGLVEIPTYFMLWGMLVYLGRKVCLVSLYIVCTLTISTVGILLVIFEEVPEGVIMFLSLLGKVAITGAYQLTFIYTAELFPTKYRSIALGESAMLAQVGSTAAPYINDLLGPVLSWGPSALFAVMSLIAAGLSLFLPETKGIDLAEDNDQHEMEVHENNTQMTTEAHVNEGFHTE